MNRKDFKPGAKGYIVRMYGSVGLPDIHINEVHIEGFRDGDAFVYDKCNYEVLQIVDLRDVYYNRADAKKAVLRYLSKQHQKFMKGAVQC